MAKKNPNDDPEEEKNTHQNNDGSDEDFGLPDLEYEELEDDTEDEVLEEEVEEAPLMSTSDQESKPDDIEEIEDDVDALDIKEGAEDEIDDPFDPASLDEDDFDAEDFDDTDIDDTANEEELAKVNIFENDDDLDETSDFDAEDLSDFEPSEDVELPGSYRTVSSEEGSGKFTKIIVIGVISFFIIAAALLFFNSQTGDAVTDQKVVKVEKPKTTTQKAPAKKEPAVSETDQKATAATPSTTAPAKAETKQEPKKQPVAQKPQPQQPAAQKYTGAPGEFAVLSERTGRSYVIIASFFDQDMATDYSEKLAANGVGTSIIPPFKESKFYRVAIAEFTSYSEAAAALGQFKGTYGDDVWALRY